MGGHEGWAEPNGLLPNTGPVIRVLDSDRWLKAEERTAELIMRIQPNQPSEERRHAVADYVQRLIMKCFPCQVFTFGSVPLKTYLPDGDIDLTAFSNNQTLKDTWANQVRDMLEKEEKDENAEFRVKEVQYIQAEVKLIKCLVENIVVDISFNQLGGLCTLCFLEEVDHLINQNHLFKRSIILLKAWCYYESRILGAHHGLISTYALETLVLYIFHVFNNSFTGPLEVLYRFLEFFSNFDWDNFCVSLWGPVSISSLPDVTAEPPRKDSGDLLLSKLFLDACSSVYAVFPGGQQNQGQAFVSKHFNVIDPLRVNNNLGRSVSKGNFFRIRSAFAFGAKRLARLLDCPKENVVYEVNQFFMNTWERHGSGHRPDAPGAAPDHIPESESSKSNLIKKLNGHFSVREMDVKGTHTLAIASQHGNNSSGGLPRKSDRSAASHSQSQKTYRNLNNSRLSDQIARESNEVEHTDKSQRNVKSDHLVNDIQGRFIFARTRSSPELTETCGDVSSHIKQNRVQEIAKTQASTSRPDSGRSNLGSDSRASHSGRSSPDDSSSVRQVPSRQNLDTAAESVSGSNSYHYDAGTDGPNEELSSTIGTRGMHQEEQDLVNMMASTSLHGFNGQVPLQFNLASPHLPFPISQSIFASMGYAQQNIPGLLPTNVPLIDPSFSNVQFPHGLVSPPLTQYFPGIGLNSNSEDGIERHNQNFASIEMNSGEAENDFWQDQEVGSSGGIEPDNGNLEMFQPDEKTRLTIPGFNFVPPPWLSGSGPSDSSVPVKQKNTKEKHGSQSEEHLDNFQFQDSRESEIRFDERTASSRFSSASYNNSRRSRTHSESSWDGPSAKVSKPTRERRGKKFSVAELPVGNGKGKVTSEHVSSPVEDDQDWNGKSSMGAEMVERISGAQSMSHLDGPRHLGYEVAQTIGSDSVIPLTSMHIGPGSQQRMNENSGLLTFYPTGPPVPFITMLPVYNIPHETGASNMSSSRFGAEECMENNDSGQNFDTTDGLEQSQDINSSTSIRIVAATSEASDEHKSDILNSDFASHWHNLQYGRCCQNPRYPGQVIYPSSVMVPPMNLQGRFPWDGPGRPVSNNNRPPNVYQRYADEAPRYRGTGTYLPNPASFRDQQSSGTTRGNYNYDRNDSHGGNWNTNSRSRVSGRNHNRNQIEKSNSRSDRISSSESRRHRPWGSYRNDTFSSYHSQNGPFLSNSSQTGPSNVAFGMYPLPSMNPSALSSNGPTVPPVVMLYPFEHNSSFGSHGEPLEFGSLGPIELTANEPSHVSEGSRARGTFEEHRFHGSSGQRSSPDKPSSPHHHRRI